jgi:phenylacetate-coenzyme A ligase PaaK-like adenylate-forming protein
MKMAADPLFAPDVAQLASLRETMFAATLDRVFAAHPYYQRKFASLGLARHDVRGLADLGKLPVTTKADYIAEPGAFVLGPAGAADETETVVWDIMYTTGSSGAPTPFVSTAYDFLNILSLNRNMLRLRGVTPADTILNLFPLTRYPHGAFARAMNAAAAMNIPVVAALPGHVNERRPDIGSRLDEVVATAARSAATILWGVPTFIRKLAMRAEELGVKLPAVRLVFVTGEGFGDAARRDLEERLRRLGAPAPFISVSYGATEMQGGMVECAPGAGNHNPAPDQFFFEAVDPRTHAPLPDGEEGLILLTHLDRRGTVMLRYALGDVARLTHARCPHCGALTERLISMPRRIDGLLKIKGMLINPQVLVDAVAAEAGVSEFQAVVAKEDAADPLSMDRLLLKVVPAADAGADLIERLRRVVHGAIGVTPEVEQIAADDPLIAERGWKAKPMIDLRNQS